MTAKAKPATRIAGAVMPSSSTLPEKNSVCTVRGV